MQHKVLRSQPALKEIQRKSSKEQMLTVHIPQCTANNADRLGSQVQTRAVKTAEAGIILWEQEVGEEEERGDE